MNLYDYKASVKIDFGFRYKLNSNSYYFNYNLAIPLKNLLHLSQEQIWTIAYYYHGRWVGFALCDIDNNYAYVLGKQLRIGGSTTLNDIIKFINNVDSEIQNT